MSPTKIDEQEFLSLSVSKLMTADDLSRYSSISKTTVIRNRAKIPGYQQNVSDDYLFDPGTRYPFWIGFHSLETTADRRYVLLKAISQYRYISYVELNLHQEQFFTMLEEYAQSGLIAQNVFGKHFGKSFGANGYDCTSAGDFFLEKLEGQKRAQRIETIESFIRIITPIILDGGKIIIDDIFKILFDNSSSNDQ